MCKKLPDLRRIAAKYDVIVNRSDQKLDLVRRILDAIEKLTERNHTAKLRGKTLGHVRELVATFSGVFIGSNFRRVRDAQRSLLPTSTIGSSLRFQSLS